MPNSDSFTVLRSDYPTGHPFQTAALSLASTTETVFSLANGGAAVVGVPSQTAILGSSTLFDPNSNASISSDSLGGANQFRGQTRPYFNSSTFDSRGFRVRAMGKFSVVTAATAGGASLNIKLYVGSSTTLGSDTVLFTPATPLNVPISTTTTGNFIVEATLMWDSLTAKVGGEAWANYQDAVPGVQYNSRAGLTQVAAAAYTNLQFVASAVWSVNAPTSSTITLVEFSCERV